MSRAQVPLSLQGQPLRRSEWKQEWPIISTPGRRAKALTTVGRRIGQGHTSMGETEVRRTWKEERHGVIKIEYGQRCPKIEYKTLRGIMSL